MKISGVDAGDGPDGAGPSVTGKDGIKPSGSENELEKGDYPEPGEGVTGRPTAARALATPSRATAGGVPARGVMGDGRGSSGKFSGTMGDGRSGGGEPPHKGTSGQ